MLGRVCVPLLVRGFRVGYLWVQLAAGEPSAAAVLAQLQDVAPELEQLSSLLLDSNTAESEFRRRRAHCRLYGRRWVCVITRSTTCFRVCPTTRWAKRIGGWSRNSTPSRSTTNQRTEASRRWWFDSLRAAGAGRAPRPKLQPPQARRWRRPSAAWLWGSMTLPPE